MSTTIISNCPLCENHSLHLIGKDEYMMQQCIYCGYVSFEKFRMNGLSLEKHDEYVKLTDEMKSWVKMSDDRFWTPVIFTLPTGMLYPINENDEMKWGYARMRDIPEDEKKNYPNPAGGFYDKKYDIKNPKLYDEFLYALAELNKDSKNET